MPPLPMELQSSCDALYIYECQQAGLSINDLEKLSYRQVQTLLDIRSSTMRSPTRKTTRNLARAKLPFGRDASAKRQRI